MTAVWATDTNRKLQVTNPTWPLRGSVNQLRSMPWGARGAPPRKHPPLFPGSLPHKRRQRTSMTAGMIHGWAQPWFSKEQPFLNLAKTMRTWVKELAPLCGSYIKVALYTVKSGLFLVMRDVVGWCVVSSWGALSMATRQACYPPTHTHTAGEALKLKCVWNWQNVSSNLPFLHHTSGTHTSSPPLTLLSHLSHIVTYVSKELRWADRRTGQVGTRDQATDLIRFNAAAVVKAAWVTGVLLFKLLLWANTARNQALDN